MGSEFPDKMEGFTVKQRGREDFLQVCDDLPSSSLLFEEAEGDE